MGCEALDGLEEPRGHEGEAKGSDPSSYRPALRFIEIAREQMTIIAVAFHGSHDLRCDRP